MPYRATYDIESLLVKDDLPSDTGTLTFKNRHRLLSVSVCSNVPGFTDPVCFVIDDETSDDGGLTDANVSD